MAAAAARFQLSPESFWALSWAEWSALADHLGGGAEPAPMTRAEFDRLVRDEMDGNVNG